MHRRRGAYFALIAAAQSMLYDAVLLFHACAIYAREQRQAFLMITDYFSLQNMFFCSILRYRLHRGLFAPYFMFRFIFLEIFFL